MPAIDLAVPDLVKYHANRGVTLWASVSNYVPATGSIQMVTSDLVAVGTDAGQEVVPHKGDLVINANMLTGTQGPQATIIEVFPSTIAIMVNLSGAASPRAAGTWYTTDANMPYSGTASLNKTVLYQNGTSAGGPTSTPVVGDYVLNGGSLSGTALRQSIITAVTDTTVTIRLMGIAVPTIPAPPARIVIVTRPGITIGTTQLIGHVTISPWLWSDRLIRQRDMTPDQLRAAIMSYMSLPHYIPASGAFFNVQTGALHGVVHTLVCETAPANPLTTAGWFFMLATNAAAGIAIFATDLDLAPWQQETITYGWQP